MEKTTGVQSKNKSSIIFSACHVQSGQSNSGFHHSLDPSYSS